MPERKSTKREANTEKPKRKVGRPSSYTAEIGELICDRIATTSDSLRKICASDDRLPESETVRMWCWKIPEFHAQYARAKAAQQEWMAELAQDIADEGVNDTYIDEETGMARVDHDVIQRSRLRVDTIKWRAAKLAPKRFGEKVDVNHGVQEGNPLEKLLEQVSGTPFKPRED